MYLLDTNILSDLRKRQRNQGVLDFFAQVKSQRADCFISVITLGEIQAGIHKLSMRNDKAQADSYQSWLDTIHTGYRSYKLNFDEDCALKWAYLTAHNPHNIIDKQIAATALVHNLTLVTRNMKDFDDIGAINTPLKLLNPFT